MANDNFTRTGFDLSPWRGKDPLTISEAACLWYGLTPGMTEKLIDLYPVAWKNTQNRAKDMAEEAKAGRLPIVGTVRTYQPRTRRAVRSKYLGGGVVQQPAGQKVEDWGATPVALADLRTYAKSIGERPAFFFPDVAAASGQSLNERVKERAQQIADELFKGGNCSVFMTTVAKKLEAEAGAKRKEGSMDDLYIGQKGEHKLSWYKSELKGWKPEK